MGPGVGGGQSKLSLALLAEASPSIGTGHVMEAFSIAQGALDRGWAVQVWVNAGAPETLVQRAPCPLHTVPEFSPPELGTLSEMLLQEGTQVAITDLRRITNDQVQALRGHGLRVLTIDEWGNTHLDSDIVVNNSPVREYHRYTSDNPNFKLYAGPQYLALSPEYQELHGTPRHHRGSIQSLLVAMGGGDVTGATPRIVECLLPWPGSMVVHVVLGPGFQQMEQLKAVLGAHTSGRFAVHQGLASLASLLASCDASFTAGGNTLCELACVGTPAIVLFEDEHERLQALAFQELGAALCLGSGQAVRGEDVRATIERLQQPERRRAMADAGRALVDGRGAERILALAAGLVTNDSPIAATSH